MRPFALRRIATGAHALRKPTDGRHSYLMSEFARELGVDTSSVSRWIARGYIKAEKHAAGFWTIDVDEAVRFSREGPPRQTPPPTKSAERKGRPPTKRTAPRTDEDEMTSDRVTNPRTPRRSIHHDAEYS